MAKSDRGFASMSARKARSIQSKGGKSSKLSHEQAREIGRLGGLARARNRALKKAHEKVVSHAAKS